MSARAMIATVCAVIALGEGAGGGQAREEFRIDAASSLVVVHVGRAGLLAFAGHDHEVLVPSIDGSVLLDHTDVSRSIVRLQFDASAVRVTGKDEPPADVAEVQRIMLSDRVLDVDQHPTITFASRTISPVKQSADQVMLRVEGDLTLRGVTRSVTLPVGMRLSAEHLIATAKATVRQTLFGIRPVTAAAGAIKVKDDVEIAFTLVGCRI